MAQRPWAWAAAVELGRSGKMQPAWDGGCDFGVRDWAHGRRLCSDRFPPQPMGDELLSRTGRKPWGNYRFSSARRSASTL
jgi:hypothetical protein